MALIKLGDIAQADNVQSPPLRVSVSDPIDEFVLVLTGNLVAPAGGVVLLEEAILRIIRRIDITLGGMPFKLIGSGEEYASAGRLLEKANRLQYGELPTVTQPATAEGTNAFLAELRIPCSLPPVLHRALGGPTPDGKFSTNRRARQATVLKVVDRDIDFVVNWGDVTDLTATAGATITEVSLEVLANTDPALLLLETSPWFFKEATQQLPLTAAATIESLDLNRQGLVPYILLFGFDTSLKDDDNFNVCEVLANNADRLIKGTWNALKAAARQAGSSQVAVPTGVALLDFDTGRDGDGMIPAGDLNQVRKLELILDHDAMSDDYRLAAHHWWLARE